MPAATPPSSGVAGTTRLVETDIAKACQNGRSVRGLIHTHWFFAVRWTDDRLGRCFVEKHFTPGKNGSRSVRAPHEFKTSAVG